MKANSKKKASQASKAADGAAFSKLNSRGPAFEGAEVPDNTFQDGKVSESSAGMPNGVIFSGLHPIDGAYPSKGIYSILNIC